MKKIILMLMSICIIISMISSCTRNDKIDFENDRYIYTLSNGTLKRYDLSQKTISIACPDPLCNHGDDCLVTNIDGYTVAGRYIFLERGLAGFGIKLYVYDIVDNEISFLTNGSQASQVYMADEYAFFTLGEYVYNDSGDIEKQIFNIYRYNTNTNTLEKLSNDDLSGFCNLILYKEGSLYWDILISTDINFQNKKELSVIEYNQVIKDLNTVEGTHFNIGMDVGPIGSIGRSYNLQVTDIETGESKVFVDCANSFRWTNLENRNGLIYIPAKYVWEIIDGEEVQVLQPENKIVYINTYDLSDTKTWEIPEGLSIATVTGSAGTCWYVGKYTTISTQIYNYDDSGVLYRYDAMFVMNYETGESFVMVDDTSGMEVKAEETE